MDHRTGRKARHGLFLAGLACLVAFLPALVRAAPYAAHVVDARSGEVLYSENADTRLHPASLTKMMTLYIVFGAIERGEISLDTKVTISSNAAAEPPSRLGLKAGQKIAVRYLIRAAALRSANDAATALGEAVSGSESAFAERMNRTAKALGMSKSSFRNANGLTAEGHMSTARDMTTLGRRLFYDFPQYYNIFSRRTSDAGMAEVANTNRRFLDSYAGADGIKTGFTNPAGFNLTASAERGGKRLVATVLGGKSTAHRNVKMAELLDLGFKKAPSRAPGKAPEPMLVASADPESAPVGKTIRLVGAPNSAARPKARPDPGEEAVEGPDPALVVAMKNDIANVLAEVQEEKRPAGPAPVAPPQPRPQALTVAAAMPAEVAEPVAEPAAAPQPRPEQIAALAEPAVSAPLQNDARTAEALATAVEVAAQAPQAVTTQAIVPAPAARRPEPQPIAIAAVVPQTQAQTPKSVTPPKPVPAALAPAPPEQPEVVTRVSTSGGRHWGINVGKFNTRYEAEKVLLKTALAEISTLDGSLRKVVQRSSGFEATFMGLSRETADLACRRLQARNTQCFTIGP